MKAIKGCLWYAGILLVAMVFVLGLPLNKVTFYYSGITTLIWAFRDTITLFCYPKGDKTDKKEKVDDTIKSQTRVKVTSCVIIITYAIPLCWSFFVSGSYEKFLYIKEDLMLGIKPAWYWAGFSIAAAALGAVSTLRALAKKARKEHVEIDFIFISTILLFLCQAYFLEKYLQNGIWFVILTTMQLAAPSVLLGVILYASWKWCIQVVFQKFFQPIARWLFEHLPKKAQRETKALGGFIKEEFQKKPFNTVISLSVLSVLTLLIIAVVFWIVCNISLIWRVMIAIPLDNLMRLLMELLKLNPKAIGWLIAMIITEITWIKLIQVTLAYKKASDNEKRKLYWKRCGLTAIAIIGYFFTRGFAIAIFDYNEVEKGVSAIEVLAVIIVIERVVNKCRSTVLDDEDDEDGYEDYEDEDYEDDDDEVDD